MEKVSPVVKTIRSEMKRLDWTPQRLAEESGIGFQTIYRIYSGENIPNLDTVERLLSALKLKVVVGR